jgi:inosine/xanthosine triphosphate pyrophosphatase family protein
MDSVHDYIFKPIGFDLTYAQMTITEKLSISARKCSIMKLLEYIKDN